jgi:hypothetical protein
MIADLLIELLYWRVRDDSRYRFGASIIRRSDVAFAYIISNATDSKFKQDEVKDGFKVRAQTVGIVGVPFRADWAD